MPTFSNIDGEESATVTFTVGAVSLTRNSSAELQEILCIGDPEVATSLGLARVTNAAPASTNAGLNVRILSGPSSVADFSVRPIAPSTYGDGGLYRVAQSSAGDLNVTVAGYSTIAQVSSVAGIVTVAPGSTAPSTWFVTRMTDGSTFITDSTLRAIRVTSADVGGSTQVAVSSLAGAVIMRSSAADALGTVYQSTFADLRATVHNSTIGDLLASVQQNSSVWQVQAGSTNWPKAAGLSVDSSNVQNVKLDGSTAITIGAIAAGAGRINIGSTATDNVVIARSSAADALGTVYQSSYGALLANVHNSTIGDLLASVQQNSTVWQVQAKIQDSSAVGFVGTVTRPTSGAQGMVVRQVLNGLQSTCFSTQGNNSTGQAVVSSVANQSIKVYAYSITSTVQAVNTLSFASSLANPIWQIQMQSVSSGISGANLAVSPPAWLFATAANEALNFKVTGTTGTYHLSFSYFIEA